jgi:hypothetical protein
VALALPLGRHQLAMTKRWKPERCKRCGSLDPWGICDRRCFASKTGLKVPDSVWAAVRRAERRISARGREPGSVQAGGNRNPDSKAVREWGQRAERKELARVARRQEDARQPTQGA